MEVPFQMRIAALGNPNCHPADIPSATDIKTFGLVGAAGETSKSDLVEFTSKVIGTIYGRLKPGPSSDVIGFLKKYKPDFDAQLKDEEIDFRPQDELSSTSAIRLLFGELEAYAEGISESQKALGVIDTAKRLACFAIAGARGELETQQPLQEAG